MQARHLEQRSNRLHLAQQQQQKLQQAAHLQQQQAHSAIKGQAAAATALHSKPVLGHTIQQQQAMAQAQNAALVSSLCLAGRCVHVLLAVECGKYLSHAVAARIRLAVDGHVCAVACAQL